MSDKTPIFKWIWDVCPAKNGDKLVLLCLACFADPKKDGECWAAPEMLEAKTGMTRRNIYRCMQRLVANGWLILGAERKVEHGRTLCRRYRIPYSLDNLSDLSSDNLSSSSDNLSVSLDNLSSSSDKLYTDNKDKEHKEKKNTSADAPAPATALPSPPSSSPVTVPRPKPPKFDPATLALPHGAGLAHAWAEFAQHRREIKAPLTPTAAQRIIADLAAVNEANAVEALRKSVKHGWRGVFLDNLKDAPKVVHIPRTGPVQPSEAERRMLALEALQADRMKGAA
jgi:predicted transcriptional regulator